MEEHMLSNRIYSYMFYALAGVVLIVSVFFYSILLFALAAVLVFLSALYYSSGHIINNILLKRSLVIEIYNGYRLDATTASAVKKIGNVYHSVSVAVLALNRGVNVGNSEMLSLIESINEPFDFSISLREVNRKMVLEGLETKRRMREIALARVSDGSYDKANEIKRELEIFDKEIEGIRSRGKPLDLSVRIRTASTSQDEADAARSSLASLTHITDSFSTILNADYTVLKGEELLFSLG